MASRYSIKVILLCLLMLLLPNAVTAETAIPLTNDVTENKVVVNKLPLPHQLISGWWTYFDVSDELLSQRIAEASSAYNALLVPLSPAESKAASYQLNAFISNLKMLQQLRRAPPQKIDAEQRPYQQYYSIDEWLAIADQLRKQQLEVEDKKQQLARETRALKTTEKQLSSLRLAYLDLQETDASKVSLGLEGMAVRSAIELNSAQLHLKRTLFEQYDEQLRQLQLLSKTASDQLSADQAYIENLNKEQQKLNQKLSEAQKNAQQINLFTDIENNPLSLNTARLQAQQAISNVLEVSGLDVQLQVTDAKKALAGLLLAAKEDDIALWQEKLPLWQMQVLENQQNAQTWYRDTSLELEQAQEQMITLMAEGTTRAEQLENAPLIAVLKQHLSLAQACLVSLKQMDIDRYALQNLIEEIEQRMTERSGKWLHFFDWSRSRLTSFKISMLAWSSEPLFTIGETPITLSGVFKAVIIFFLATFISKLFRKGMQRLTERSAKDTHGHGVSAFYTIGRLVHYIILLLGIIIALATIGLDFTNLALVAGALSVGIGFGLQSIVNNFVSGLILLFEGTIKIGDFIELDSKVMGVVREINVRSTQINTTDNVDIIVPNSMLVTDKVINWTLQDNNRRIHIPFGVAYGTDKEKVKKAVLEAASRVPYTHKPRHTEAAHCWLVNFGDSSLDFELVVWIHKEAVLRPNMIHARYLWEIETSLKEHNIEIPFPQRDLHIRS